MGAGRSLTIDIRTADAQTLAALKRIQKELKDTGTTAQHTSKQGLSLGSALGGLAIGAGLSAAIGEFEEAQTTLRKTEAVIKSTGNAAGVSAEQQAKMVDSFSKLAAVDDEVVAGGANILRTFKQVKSDAFEPALGAALDLSAALGTDLQSATLQVGKALNDPTKGVTALTRAGVSFTAQQKEQIKAMQEAGDIAGAQRLILSELEKQFGGQAEAAATDSAKMKVAFSNAAESLGGALAPALAATASVAERASTAFQGLPQPIQQAALAGGALAIVGPKIAEGWSSAAESMQGAKAALQSSVSDFGAVKAGALGAATGLAAYNTAYSFLESQSRSDLDLEGLAKDLKLVGDGASDLTPIYEQFGGSAESMAGKIRDLNGALDESNVDKVGRTLVGLVKGDAASGVIEVQKLKNEFAGLDETLSNMDPEQAKAAFLRLTAEMVAQGVTVDQLTGLFPKYYAEVDRAAKVSSAAAASNANYANSFGVVNDAIAGALDAGVKANQAFAGYLQSSLDVNQAVVDVADAQDKLADSNEAVADAERGVADASQAVADARRGVADAEAAVGDALKGVETARRAVTEAEKDAAAAREDVTKATEDLAQAEADAKIDSDYMADALQGVTDAEERLALSQADSQAAQAALTEARANYGQTLRDLSDDAAGAADDVALAEIAIRDAQKRAAEVAADPKATADDRERAAIAIREAERRLRDAQERAEQAKKDLERNQANGAEGSDAVVAAQDAVTAAAGREEEAQGNLEDAVLNVATTQEEAAGRVITAQDNLTAATDRRAAADQRVVDARQGVVDANGAVQKAVEGVETANRNVSSAVDGTIAAQGRYADAKEAAKAAQAEVQGAVEDVKDALDIQATSWATLVTTFKFGGPLRSAVRGVTGELKQLAGDYDVNVNLGGNAANAILTGVSNPFLDALAAAVGQPPGGRSSAGGNSTGTKSGPAAVPATTSGNRAEVTINVIGADDPAAVAEMTSRRVGWELTHLNGAA